MAFTTPRHIYRDPSATTPVAPFRSVSSQARSWCRAPVAQLVEHLICNQEVVGSIPAGGTNEIKGLR